MDRNTYIATLRATEVQLAAAYHYLAAARIACPMEMFDTFKDDADRCYAKLTALRGFIVAVEDFNARAEAIINADH